MGAEAIKVATGKRKKSSGSPVCDILMIASLHRIHDMTSAICMASARRTKGRENSEKEILQAVVALSGHVARASNLAHDTLCCAAEGQRMTVEKEKVSSRKDSEK